MSDERFVAIEQRLDSLVAGQDALRRGMQDLRAETREMGADLGRQMRVLHEDTLDKIKALAPDLEPIRRELRLADEALHDRIDARLLPLETAVRQRER